MAAGIIHARLLVFFAGVGAVVVTGWVGCVTYTTDTMVLTLGESYDVTGSGTTLVGVTQTVDVTTTVAGAAVRRRL